MNTFDVLRKYWNYNSFKGPQEKIINAVLNQKNTIAVLPTGGGKSLCYQIPALLQDGVCLVISPLIALMNDQVNTLKTKGIKAIAITSILKQEDIITAFDNLQYGNYKFLYLSPEKLQSEFIQEKIKSLRINLIAIDEVHCISEWGHDFRPSYLKIPAIKEIHPDTPIIGLTATATPRVLKDIIKNLELPDAQIYRQSLFRKNLALKIIESDNYFYHIKQLIETSKFPSIIFASSRKKVKEVSEYLNKNKLKSNYYHGGLSNEEKQVSFSNWMEEKVLIMVATNAFGMGIDKDNVQHIIHMDLPSSLENYMQEAGRAGRNENKAYSHIFVTDHTILNLKNSFSKGLVSVALAKKIYKDLNRYFQIAYGELPDLFFEINLTEFCSHYGYNILQTYNALKIFEKERILDIDENFNKPSTLKFTALPHEILHYSENSNSDLIKTILRSYGGIFDNNVKINETVLAKKIGSSLLSIKNELNQIAKDGLAIYNFRKNISQIRFLVPREDDFAIHNIAANIKQRNNIKSEKINAVIAYANNNAICRSRYLLDYFGEENTTNCGICDICESKVKKSSSYNKEELLLNILNLLKIEKSLSTEEIITHFKMDSSIIIPSLQVLLDTNKIAITSQNKLEIFKNE